MCIYSSLIAIYGNNRDCLLSVRFYVKPLHAKQGEKVNLYPINREVTLDHSSMASAVTQIAVEDIESYALGLCCLQDKQDEPLINAFMQLNLHSRG